MKIKSYKVYKKDLGNKRPYTIAFKTVTEVFSAIGKRKEDWCFLSF